MRRVNNPAAPMFGPGHRRPVAPPSTSRIMPAAPLAYPASPAHRAAAAGRARPWYGIRPPAAWSQNTGTKPANASRRGDVVTGRHSKRQTAIASTNPAGMLAEPGAAPGRCSAGRDEEGRALQFRLGEGFQPAADGVDIRGEEAGGHAVRQPLRPAEMPGTSEAMAPRLAKAAWLNRWMRDSTASSAGSRPISSNPSPSQGKRASSGRACPGGGVKRSAQVAMRGANGASSAMPATSMP